MAGDDEVANAAWSYDHPTREAAAVQGRIAFYSERVDVFVDGERIVH